nr:hypothetical protein Iba_chr07cCG12430 [Ipomoea batatas]
MLCQDMIKWFRKKHRHRPPDPKHLAQSPVKDQVRKLRRFGSKSKIEEPSWNLASYAFPPDSILGYGLASQSTLKSPQSGREDWVKGKRRTPRFPQGNSSGHSSSGWCSSSCVWAKH